MAMRPAVRNAVLLAGAIACALLLLPAAGDERLRLRVPPACNPFAQAGVLDWANMQWAPADNRCAPSHLSTDLREGTVSDLSWLRNKTVRGQASARLMRQVVAIGDSIARDSVVHACAYLDGVLETIRSDDPRSPPPFTNGRDELLNDPRVFDRDPTYSRPALCRVVRFDLYIVTVFSFGMVSFEELKEAGFAYRLPHYYPPAVFEDRIEAVVVPLLRRLGRRADVVSLASNYWDVAQLVALDRARGMAEDETANMLPPFDAERLEVFRGRLAAAFDAIHAALPSARLVWRTAPEPSCSPTEVVHCTRSAQVRLLGCDAPLTIQLAQVGDELVSRRPAIAVDYYGRLLHGYTPFFAGASCSAPSTLTSADGKHPGPRFAPLFADSLLYLLRHL